MMKFPKSIKVGASVYEVSIDTELDHELAGNHRYGEINYTLRRIALSTKFLDEEKRDTLMHEVVHAITKHMGIDWGDEDEQLTRQLTNGLMMVFNDNPDLLKLLAE